MTACRVCGAPARRNSVVCTACGGDLRGYRELEDRAGRAPIRVRRYGTIPPPAQVLGAPAGAPRGRLRGALLVLLAVAAAILVVLGCVRLLA